MSFFTNRMNKQTLISIAVIVVVVIGALIFLQKEANKPKIYDTFASCLGEKGATFYGAFWCPHCAEQKTLFKGSDKLLPYVECSTPDSKGQTQACIDKGISGYPTWEFADGTRVTNVQSLSYLSTKTGCPLPSTDAPEDMTGVGESSDAQ